MKLKIFTGTPLEVQDAFNKWSGKVHPVHVEVSACTRFESCLTLCVLYKIM